jgi:hypothetical protein
MIKIKFGGKKPMIQNDPNAPAAVELREAETKLRALRSEHQVKQEQLEKLEQEYARRRSLSAKDRLETEAESVLAGMPVEEISIPEIRDLQHWIEIQSKAIELQSVVVQTARNKFTRTICEANRGRYLEIAKRISRAVEELSLANESEVQFFDELMSAGCGSGIPFRSLRLNAVGLASDKQSAAAFHRREVEQFLPEALAQ